MHRPGTPLSRLRWIFCLGLVLAIIALPTLQAGAGSAICCGGRVCDCASCPLSGEPDGEVASGQGPEAPSCHSEPGAPAIGDGPQPREAPHGAHGKDASDPGAPHSHLPSPTGGCSSPTGPLPVLSVSELSVSEVPEVLPEPAGETYPPERRRFRRPDPLTRSSPSPRGPPTLSTSFFE